jgi:hypothetical protein
MPTIQLSAQQQQAARDAAVQAAQLTYAHEPDVHYTQGSARWQGISERRIAAQGRYPNYADCSSMATWCLWNALSVPYGMEDVVNGSSWNAGYTGTMLQYGTVVSASQALPGDCVLYGTPGSTGAHTAICVTSGPTPTVISHGSEAGPYKLAYNYRADVMNIRRYIDGKPHQASGGSAPPAPMPEPPEDTVSLFAVVKQDGRIQLFVQKESGQVMQAYQTAKDGGWAGAEKGKNAKWYDLGNPGK